MAEKSPEASRKDNFKALMQEEENPPIPPPPGPFVPPGPEIPKIMNPVPAASAASMNPLPPAGDAQRDEIKRRLDSLEERARAQFPEVESINPDKIRPDNEILGPIAEMPNMLGVTNQQPGRKYKWVYTGQNGYFVTQARLQGWVPVQGNDPEAEARTWTDTTRKLGDTVLMWIPEERYRQLAQQDFQKRMLQQKSITAELEERGREMGVRVSKGFRDQAMLERLQEQAWARQVAEAKFKKMLEQGRIPGMEIG
jgi:hypothetical protein